MLVDEALTIYRLVSNGAGIGMISAYLCAADLEAGRLVGLFPEWVCPPLPVNLVYTSRREIAPAVRAFADFLKESAAQGSSWEGDGPAR
jgi:LysR family transcriptional regulator, regulator for bpeEF and oprC